MVADETVLFTCVAYGDLPLTISWSREGSVLMNDSQRVAIYEEEVEEGGITFVQSILQICSAESDDAAIYNCTAGNDVDNVTANFELTVTPLASELLYMLLFHRHSTHCSVVLFVNLSTNSTFCFSLSPTTDCNPA